MPCRKPVPDGGGFQPLRRARHPRGPAGRRLARPAHAGVRPALPARCRRPGAARRAGAARAGASCSTQGRAWAARDRKAVVVQGEVQYLAKFPTLDDRFNIPAIERATLELARRCGLTVPATELLRLPDGRDVMLIERFDRVACPGGFARRHAISALTALELHESESAQASYADISLKLAAIGASGRGAGRSHRVVRPDGLQHPGQQRRRPLAQPRLRVAARGPRLGPEPAVRRAAQAAGVRHALPAPGRGPRRTPGHADQRLEPGARCSGLQAEQAREVVDRIAHRVREWKVYFEAFGVEAKDIDAVGSAMRHPRDLGWH